MRLCDHYINLLFDVICHSFMKIPWILHTDRKIDPYSAHMFDDNKNKNNSLVHECTIVRVLFLINID